MKDQLKLNIKKFYHTQLINPCAFEKLSLSKVKNETKPFEQINMKPQIQPHLVNSGEWDNGNII